MALLCAGLTWTAGCSFVVVSGPPPDHARRAYFDCTTSNLAPAIDLTVTALTALAALNETLSENAPQRERPAAIGIPMAFAAVAAISAVSGFHDTSACTNAKLALAHRLKQKREDAPAPAMGCRADIECKGQRICVEGRCAEPAAFSPPNMPTPPPVAAPTTDAGAPTEPSLQPPTSNTRPTTPPGTVLAP